MIEQALFFAIGFLVASLAAFVAMPVMSRRAMRLARARAELNAPVTEKQAIAERDALRAVHAVEQVRLEHRLAVAEETVMELRSAEGRLRAKLTELEADGAESLRAVFDQRAEIERGALAWRDLEVALAASQIALHDALAQRDRARIVEGAAAVRQSELETEASRYRARIAILAARTEDLEARLKGLSRSEKAAADKAAAPIAQLSADRARAKALEERLGEAVGRDHRASKSLLQVDAEQNETGPRLADLEARLLLAERIREETLIENGRLLATLADREADLRMARSWAISQNESAQKVAGSLNTVTPGVVHAAAKGPSHAASGERKTLNGEIDALHATVATLGASARSGSDDATLRESIERFGRDIIRVYAQRSIVEDERRMGDRVPYNGQNSERAAEAQIPDARGFAEVPRQPLAPSHAPDC